MSDLAVTVAFSPCPNDTFIFDALVHNRLPGSDIAVEPVLDDVESLNRAAADGRYPVTKLSIAALGHLSNRYQLLDSGAALGRGCGPLVVARPKTRLDWKRSDIRIAVPGSWTTATLLLGLYNGGAVSGIVMPYDRIMTSVADGSVDAGLIIHESRFTYSDFGLVERVDLGDWWEKTTNLPIPLGGIAVRSDLPVSLGRRLTGAIADSIRFGWAHPEVSAPFIAAHAQEMDLDVARQHIDLYVNDFSLSLGDTGRLAVQTLLAMGRSAGLIPAASAAAVGSAGTNALFHPDVQCPSFPG